MSRRATVDPARLLDVVRTEAELLLATAREAAPEAQVPGCPGLTIGETVRHLGGMYRATLSWITTGQRPTTFAREPRGSQTTLSFLEDSLEALLAELGAHAALDSCASWWPEDETYGFWFRRMAHETTVHRIDVQSAARVEVAPVEDDFALDGIDEVLTLWFGRRLETLGLSGNRHASVIVRSAGRRWLATASPEGTSAVALEPEDPALDGAELEDDVADDIADDEDVENADGDADDSAAVGSGATVSAEPTPMYLWLWGRRPLYGGAVRVRGDDDAVAQLWALLRLATR